MLLVGAAALAVGAVTYYAIHLNKKEEEPQKPAENVQKIRTRIMSETHTEPEEQVVGVLEDPDFKTENILLYRI